MASDRTDTFIFIDTCSYLVSCWDREGSYSQAKEYTFWKQILPSLFEIGKVIIPQRNYEELLKHSKSTSDQSLAEHSKHVMEMLEPFIQEGKIERVGDANDPFADAILLSVALKFRTTHNMAFITQDRKLATDLTAIQNFQSVVPHGGQTIKVRRIASNGKLERHRGLSEDHPSAGKGNHQSDSPNSDGAQVRNRSVSAKPWWEA